MNWRRFFLRDKADAEQQQELEFYLDVTTEEYIALGMDPNVAQDAARKKLGNATLIREEVYEMNTLTFLEGLLRDGRHALRMIRLNPGFSTAASATEIRMPPALAVTTFCSSVSSACAS